MRQIFTISLCSLAMAGASGAALAQSTPAAETANGGLEEIIVTATKRNENLQDVPVAVSAISAKALANQGVFETSDLNHAVPNLQVSSPYGQQQPNFSLRGVGVGTEYNANAASPVGVYVDEVYQAFRSSHGQQLYDLEQIEVLRGPQGTLYGRNTTGGAINFITRKPELKGTNGYATIGYGNYNRINAEGAIEFTPIEDTLGVRIAGTYVNSDPYIINKYAAGTVTAVNVSLPGVNPSQRSTGINPGGYESYGFRGTIRLKTGGLDISLKGYAAKATGGQEVPIATGSSKTSDLIYRPSTLLNSFLPAFATHFVAGTGGTVTLAQAFQGTPGAAAYSATALGLTDKNVNSDSVGTAITRAEGAVLSIKAELANHLKLVSTSGYDSGLYSQQPNTDCDATPLRLCTIGYRSSFHAFNQDLRLDYAKGRVKLIVGAFYGKDSITADNRPDFFNALSLFNAAAGTPQSYFNPAGFFTAALVSGTDPFPMPTGITATQHFKQERTSKAIYGEGSYQIADTVKLTVGGRYTSDKTKFLDGLTTFYDDAGIPTLLSVSGNAGGAPYFLRNVLKANGTIAIPKSTNALPGTLNQSGSSNRFSGRAILDWKPSDTSLVYISYSRGYRAGTYNGLAYGGNAQVYFVPPETVNAYEAGLKSRFLDNRLQINASVFYYDYKGQQGQVVDSTATANLVALDGNLKGLEVEVLLAPTKNITLSAAFGLLDSKYDHGNCTVAFVGQQNGNCVRSGSGPADVGGNPFPFAAKSSLNLGADWSPINDGVNKLNLHVDAAYTGNFHYDAFGDYSNVPLAVLGTPVPNPAGGANLTAVPLVGGKFTAGGGDFWMANARATFTHGRYSIAGWVKNITDRTTYPYGIATEFLFGNDYRVRNQPRTYGIEATVKF
jgi:iron complex outermembrane recepter protein